MTEGPTAKAKAIRVKQIVGNEVLTRVDLRGGRRNIDEDKLVGLQMDEADAYGKNILFVFGDFAIRIHLMMYGTIHIYDLDEPLAKPESRIRLMLVFESKRVVVYNAPVVEIDYRWRILDRLKRSLGVDPLRSDWSIQKAIMLMRRHKNRKIGDVLLDQGVIAGIGNILRNEILFRARIHPERLVKDLSDAELETIAKIAWELSWEFFRRKIEGKRIGPLLMVYNKSKKPCPRCGKPIRFYRQDPNGRRTFVCDYCQR